jgi:hypothetical protein
MEPEWNIDQVAQKCGSLLHQALRRGWTATLIARAFVARQHATDSVLEPKIMLEAILDGEFDYLFFDHGQSLS